MTNLTDEEREEQKSIIREVAKDFIDGLYKEMGKSVFKALGVLLILGILAISYKLGIVEKILGV